MTRVRLCARWIWGIRTLLARMLAWGIVACPVGWLMGFLLFRVMAQLPVVITGLHEADGVAIRGGMIDLVANLTRSRACPADTQRWLWRPVVIDGRPGTQWVPLPSTVMPTLAPSGPIMLTLPIPYQLDGGGWYYRAVTQERCSWLPSALGGQMQQSEDVPVRVLTLDPRSGAE